MSVSFMWEMRIWQDPPTLLDDIPVWRSSVLKTMFKTATLWQSLGCLVLCYSRIKQPAERVVHEALKNGAAQRVGNVGGFLHVYFLSL